MAETAPTAKVLDKEAVEAETVQASPHLYIFIATGVIALAGTLAIVLLVCRKWKQKKTADSKRGMLAEFLFRFFFDYSILIRR